jgi:hypothetical protein
MSDGGEYDPEQKDTKGKDIKTSNQTKVVKKQKDDVEFDFVKTPDNKTSQTKEDDYDEIENLFG